MKNDNIKGYDCGWLETRLGESLNSNTTSLLVYRINNNDNILEDKTERLTKQLGY